MWRSLLLLVILGQFLSADAATPRSRGSQRKVPMPTIDDVIDSRWSATWCAPGDADRASITAPALPEKFTRRGYGVHMVERPDTDPEFWKRAKDLTIEGSELRSMPKESDGLYHLRGVVDAQIVKITNSESIPIGKRIGQRFDIYGPDCEAPTLTTPKEQPTRPHPPQQPPPQRPPVPKPSANICETSECSVLIRIMKADGEPCAYCPVMLTWSGGFGTAGDTTRLTDGGGFVEFRSPQRYLSTIATVVNRTGLILPLRFNVDTLGGTSLTITTPYTGR